MNFQKTVSIVFSKCIVLGARHDWWAWLSWFYTCVFGKIEILACFPQLQANIKLIRRYEGWYYTMLVYNIPDWSRIRPLPSTTLIIHTLQIHNTNNRQIG